MSLLEVRDQLGASLEGDAADLASRNLPPVSIDSRTIAAGECFVAIEGPRFDGHRFVAEALKKGAAAVIHSRPLRDLPERVPAVLLRVSDTTEALKRLGRMARRRWGGRLVAITGSMGKTTARRFAAAILRRRFPTMESPGNLNNQYGVPLALLGLRQSHRRAVLELGMNHAGEIRELGSICLPDAAALTNVAPVHLEFFRDLDGIAQAKGEILEHLGEGPLAYNADDDRVAALAAGFAGPKISFGLRRPADVRIVDCEFEGLERARYRLKIRGEEHDCQSLFAGEHFLYNVAAAAAIAVGEGIEPGEAAAGVEALQAPPGRGTALRLRLSDEPGHLTVFDDSYNSNPKAVEALLATLAAARGFERRILALGEMLELGTGSEFLHREAGRLAASLGPDLLWTVGAGGKWILEGALEAGYPADRAFHFDDSRTAGEALASRLRHGDLLAVKGSRGARMEGLIERVREIRERRTA